MSLIANIKASEGFAGMSYKDSLGFDTIGFGTKLPLTREEAELILKYRLDNTIKELLRYKPFVAKMPENKQEILYEMAYQLGVGGLLEFKKMWWALEYFNYNEASKEMLDSLWAKQTPKRARKLAERMKGL